MMGFNPMPNPGLCERYPQAYISMGETAENVAVKYAIARGEQEAFAIASQQRAAAAQAQGRFDAEIVPIAQDGATHRAPTAASGPRRTPQGLAALKPAFDAKGSVTAGTSSPLTDGAAAVLVCSEDYARKHGLKPLARIRSIAVAGCAPEIMGIGPVPASRKALERAGLTIADIDVAEVNEAFAAQSLAVLRDLGLDPAKVNIDGGAIALGHPLGASGARITGKAASLLARERQDSRSPPSASAAARASPRCSRRWHERNPPCRRCSAPASWARASPPISPMPACRCCCSMSSRGRGKRRHRRGCAGPNPPR